MQMLMLMGLQQFGRQQAECRCKRVGSDRRVWEAVWKERIVRVRAVMARWIEARGCLAQVHGDVLRWLLHGKPRSRAEAVPNPGCSLASSIATNERLGTSGCSPPAYRYMFPESSAIRKGKAVNGQMELLLPTSVATRACARWLAGEEAAACALEAWVVGRESVDDGGHFPS